MESYTAAVDGTVWAPTCSYLPTGLNIIYHQLHPDVMLNGD